MAEPKFLEAAVAYADLLAQWALATLGASAAVLIANPSARPPALGPRSAYWLFPPGWVALSISLYFGVRVHSDYIGFIASKQDRLLATLEEAALFQECAFIIGISLFAAWLLAYFVSWYGRYK